jgi:hypothetical protein
MLLHEMPVLEVVRELLPRGTRSFPLLDKVFQSAVRAEVLSIIAPLTVSHSRSALTEPTCQQIHVDHALNRPPTDHRRRGHT